MGRYFGTDGFRGEAGEAPSGIHSYKIGAFFGAWCKTDNTKKPRILVGKDTRHSSDMLEYAIGAGLMSAGADVYFSGIVTTPALSFLVKKNGFDGGVMISASHNPYSDNGIKLFSSNGEKPSDALCDKIEDYIDACTEFENTDLSVARGERIGKAHKFSPQEYESFLIESAKCRFDGLKIALDCANGSTYTLAQRVFASLGASVYSINSSPDGININRDCGSTHTNSLSNFVRSGDFDAGFAFDGDGDRCIASDSHGRILCGDEVLFLLAKYISACGELKNGSIVATVMSNLGLYSALEKEGIGCIGCAVGDRFVWESMQKHDLNLGGEQSGHVIIRPYLHTGDGILTAIKVLEATRFFGMDLSQTKQMLTLLPQYSTNVRVKSKNVINSPEVVEKAIQIRTALEGYGRLILRPSGTEPIIRIMVEAQTDDLCRKYAEQIKNSILHVEEEI